MMPAIRRLLPSLLLAAPLCLAMEPASPPSQKAARFSITSAKGSYVLYWDVVYQMNVTNSWSTVIEPPIGYTLVDIIIGDSKLFRTERNENRAVVKRLAPDNVQTNMTLVLQGPDRIDRTLTFELTGNNDTRVSSVQFIMPTDRESNGMVEAAKALYSRQLSEALSAKEQEMTWQVQEKTMKEVTTFRFGSYAKSTSTKEYGVKVFLNSVLNAGGKGYVYLSTNASDPECQVVQLFAIKGDGVAKPIKQVHATVDRDITNYVYETSPFVKDGKKHKYKFLLKIYQDTTSISAKIQ
ncbi:MAG TPA: hypothetical protein VK465_02245 [Fibrobacteria bacterium]|nr:hypothetical protein [Fibrobacteria bacterium]